jgi:hypothetical protein
VIWVTAKTNTRSQSNSTGVVRRSEVGASAVSSATVSTMCR